MRWESFGDSGTSGMLQCVVNEPASEHEPRTELYIADTLKRNIRHQTFVCESSYRQNLQTVHTEHGNITKTQV